MPRSWPRHFSSATALTADYKIIFIQEKTKQRFMSQTEASKLVKLMKCK